MQPILSAQQWPIDAGLVVARVELPRLVRLLRLTDMDIKTTADAFKLAQLVQSIAAQASTPALDEVAVERVARRVVDGLIAEERKALANGVPHARPAEFEPSATYSRTATCDAIDRALKVAKSAGKRLVVVSGPSGSSKTFASRHALHRAGSDQYLVEFSAATTAEDLIERPWTNSEGKLVWVEQAVVRAARTGGAVILDEFDLADPAVVGRLHGILDGSGTVRLASGEELKAHPDFVAIACCNGLRRDTGGSYSVQSISSALLGRAVFVSADYLNEADEVALYVAHGYPAAVAATTYKQLSALRRIFVAGKLSIPPSPRLGLAVLAAIEDCGCTVDQAWEVALLAGLDKKTSEAVQQALAATNAL
jgi:hypothetical protein